MRRRSSWIVGRWLCVLIQVGGLTGCSLVTAPTSSQLMTQSAPPAGTVAFLRDGDIWLYDENHQQVQPIVTAELGVILWPAFLPDDSGILYIQHNQIYYEVWLYQLATRTTEFITALPGVPQQLVVAPNSRQVLLTMDGALFLIDCVAKTQTRLHEGVTEYAWSPNSRSILYQTMDDRLLKRTFKITGQLGEPEVVIAQALRSPVFLSDHELLFEAVNAAGRYTVMRYAVDTKELSSVTNLDFAEPALTVIIRLSPKLDQLLYVRGIDEETTVSTWLIHLQKDASKLLLQEPTAPVWSGDGSALYYVTAASKLYTMATTGLNKTLISPVGSDVTTTAL